MNGIYCFFFTICMERKTFFPFSKSATPFPHWYSLQYWYHHQYYYFACCNYYVLVHSRLFLHWESHTKMMFEGFSFSALKEN
jgi:hypothetical protein